MNSTNHIGNLTDDPDIQYFETGSCKTKFTIAVNDGWGDKQETHFIQVECWKKTAENVAKFCRKGSKVAVTGRLKQDRWEDKETNQKRSKLYIVANQVEFLSPKAVSDENEPETKMNPADDDIPF